MPCLGAPASARAEEGASALRCAARADLATAAAEPACAHAHAWVGVPAARGARTSGRLAGPTMFSASLDMMGSMMGGLGNIDIRRWRAVPLLVLTRWCIGEGMLSSAALRPGLPSCGLWALRQRRRGGSGGRSEG